MDTSICARPFGGWTGSSARCLVPVPKVRHHGAVGLVREGAEIWPVAQHRRAVKRVDRKSGECVAKAGSGLVSAP
jgi:hypothetical protein